MVESSKRDNSKCNGKCQWSSLDCLGGLLIRHNNVFNLILPELIREEFHNYSPMCIYILDHLWGSSFVSCLMLDCSVTTGPVRSIKCWYFLVKMSISLSILKIMYEISNFRNSSRYIWIIRNERTSRSTSRHHQD